MRTTSKIGLGSQLAFGIAITFVLSATAGASQHVYRDEFESGYENWSWAEANCNFSGTTYEGQTACRVHYPDSWTGFFAGTYRKSTVGYDSLCFAVSSESSTVNAGNIVVKLKDDNYVDIGNGISLWSYVNYDTARDGPYIDPGEWHRVCVPLIWLQGVDREINGIMIMSSVPDVTLIFDDMKLTHTGFSVPGTFYTDGPAIGIIDESWPSTRNPYWSGPALSSSQYVHQGDQSYFAEFQQPWDALKFRSTIGIATEGRALLNFWIMSPDAVRLMDLEVQLRGFGDVVLGSRQLRFELTNLPNNEWIPVTVDLDRLLGSSRPVIESFVLQATAPGIGTIFVDDVSIASHDFRMPLRDRKSWLLTTSAGDIGCTQSASGPVPSHTGINFFSVDFDNVSHTGGTEIEVDVWSVGRGVVIEMGVNDPHNGNYVVIEHSDRVQSRILHLRDAPLVQLSQLVDVDTKIGVLGSAPGDHTHLGFRYRVDGQTWSGADEVAELDRIRLEGLPIRSYLAECHRGSSSVTNANRFYPSSG